jgi:hypothetical protein
MKSSSIQSRPFPLHSQGNAITGPEIIWLTGIHPNEVGKRERNSE